MVKLSHVSDGFVRKLSQAQRDLLVDHIDGEVAVSTACQSAVRNSLIRFGLLRGSTAHTIRPRFTALTEAGRLAVGKILGQCADALIRAGVLEQEHPAQALLRLRALARTGAAEPAPEHPAP